MIYLIIGLLWYVSGVCSVVYWLTKTTDLKVNDLCIAGFVGLLGPIMFVIGYLAVNSEKVIMKKRKNK